MSLIGKNLKKLRTVKKLSQQALADLIGLKRGALGAYEEGRSEPKIDTLIKIANEFSISIDALLLKELTVNDLLHFHPDYEQTFKNENHDTQGCNVTWVAAEHQTAYPKFCQDILFLKELPQSWFPFAVASLRAFEVSESVNQHKFLKAGEWLIAQKVELNEVSEHELCVFITSDQILIDTKSPKPETLQEVWKVQYKLGEIAEIPTDNLSERVNNLEEIVKQLIQK